MMDDIFNLVLERNVRETKPFVAIHGSNAILWNQIDALQAKCEELERDLVVQEEKLDHHHSNSAGGFGGAAHSAALKNETRLRDKLERLQEQLNEKLKEHSEEQANALTTAKTLAEVKDMNIKQEKTISELSEDNGKKDRALEHMSTELEDAKSRTKLAEQQYRGLKDTIRVLQEENDLVKKENREFESRFIGEKEKLSSEMNKLTEMVERQKKEIDMLRKLKDQDEKRKAWFGLSSIGIGSSSTAETPPKAKKVTAEDKKESERKFGSTAIVPPSVQKHIVTAHTAEASCVRYDRSDLDLVATCSADSTVKVWDTSTGSLAATLRGGSSNAILSCDIGNGIVAGGGSDKTCRIWNLRTQRMIHHLVGHAHKITCVRLFGGDKGIVTGSADRSIKVWDISRQTYRQTTTLRHSSTANSVDIGIDSYTAVTAHLDGGLRFWDIRTSERTADVSQLHEGAITSVQFHPTDSTKVLTNGMDSCLKIVDIRTCMAVHVLKHADFQTSYGWSSSCFSPDGKYVAAGSSSNGHIFVWDTVKGELKRKLAGHESGVCGFAWGRGGPSGQQVASVDKSGVLILWA